MKADQDGYFRFSQLSRQEHEVVFDPKVKKVPNPKLDEEKAKREEEIKKRAEEYEKK